ncbi:hybrid sensor histidine kinase/response regulator [Arenimonas donghaensis]|uniref:histidine kinase n=1 Tax=Arenimonas donghaensis DSM 18148 = HO3-R19 TaxID=1121014 RepID=A0A087MJ65_9GAMM|nr:hybrid sensor histidine kinase/response regulator [Arenimonas donghaensis]KFL36918.1 hypothetical protein N788_12380 [Arenimonas donghaensis DSM 18148 = HO3-R19]
MNDQNTALVMVVDDQEANVSAVGGLLARDGFDVAPCLSGKEALASIAADLPDLVLLDMRMPGMDGFEVLEALQGDEATREIPVIFLTADHERDSLVRAFSAGAVDYVTKPFVPEELLSRVRAHTALKMARDHMQQLAQERQESLELIAHDLRNHFTNVIFSADMLASRGQDESVAKLVESIRGAADTGLLFLQAVLDQAAGEARGEAVEPLPAAQVVRDAVDAYAERAQAKDMRLDLQLEGGLLVRGQRLALCHVLQNLVSNAIKYAPAGSVVTVKAIAHKDRVRLLVIDQGPGIPEKEQGDLFRRFAKLSSQPTGGESSTGLGLSLAKQKARAMGGDLWYDPAPTGGACFTLELPGVA